MLVSVVPEIQHQFNFDMVLIFILVAYIIYGYFSGGHKQIRLSINLILPFIIIYYLGRNITKYLYDPLSTTLFYELIAELTPIFKYTTGMIVAYLITYFLLFFFIFILSLYAKKYILNENMRAKLGKKNNIIGGIFAFINGYVLIYFLILPALSLNLIGPEARVTDFVLQNPPPFSRIARTAETAVPIKNLADKAESFQQLLSVEGLETYYNDAIYTYQQQYVGSNDSLEAQLMLDIYPELTDESRSLIESIYTDLYGEPLATQNYFGVSLTLVQETNDGFVYELVNDYETQFNADMKTNLELIEEHNQAIEQYAVDLVNYEYQLAYEAYQDELDTYNQLLSTHLQNKLDAFVNQSTYTDTFTMSRPVLTEEEPPNYTPYDTAIPPVNPETNVPQAVTDAKAFVNRYRSKEDVREQLNIITTDIKNHQGLIEWFVLELDDTTVLNPTNADISPVIISFKTHYEDIILTLNDDELETKLYQARMSIQTYDVFTLWLTCTENNIQTVSLDTLEDPQYRCDLFDTSTVTDYDFVDNAMRVVSTLFEGEQVSWLIMQYKYDYEAGRFDDVFDDYPEVREILADTKVLVDEYDLYYKDIASSIEGNISMVVKIGISVMKYHLDVYDTMQNTPLISAFYNDIARMCGSRTTSNVNPNVQICQQSEGDSGMIRELFNMQYLTSEIAVKAYVMIDDNNEPITYDTETMQAFIVHLNQAVEDDVLTKEVIGVMADQFAFHVTDQATNMTLLEQMYIDGNITIEAMRILANDEYELFSDEFTKRVKSLIR
ncbi:MAG: CvpA family protein [Candidatus Izimaplasma sp.]|nr:CvpA family protein [Candidatus Izimaplasma bacterium]